MSAEQDALVDALIDAELEKLTAEMAVSIQKLSEANPEFSHHQKVSGALCLELAKIRVRLNELEGARRPACPVCDAVPVVAAPFSEHSAECQARYLRDTAAVREKQDADEALAARGG